MFLKKKVPKSRPNEKLFQLWYCGKSGGFPLSTNSFCEFSNSSQIKNVDEFPFFSKKKVSRTKLIVNIIILEKKSGEKSPKRKTILTTVLHQKWRFVTKKNSYCEFSNSLQLHNFEGFRFELKKMKKSGEKSPKRKTILTMVLHKKWRFFACNKFFLRIFKILE